MRLYEYKGTITGRFYHTKTGMRAMFADRHIYQRIESYAKIIEAWAKYSFGPKRDNGWNKFFRDNKLKNKIRNYYFYYQEIEEVGPYIGYYCEPQKDEGMILLFKDTSIYEDMQPGGINFYPEIEDYKYLTEWTRKHIKSRTEKQS